MDWFPAAIRKVSLPSVVFFTLFFWNGIVYVSFSRILALNTQERARYLLFGLTSLSLALYSFATFELYSATDFRMILFCDQLQLTALVFAFLFFLLFTCEYLKIRQFYLRRVAPFLTLVFLPFLFWDGMFLKATAEFRVFTFLSYNTRVTEAALGPFYFIFVTWTVPHLLFLTWCWLRHYWKHIGGWILPLGFGIFMLTVLNDICVATNLYRFFYILELGFVVFVLSMAFQIFRFYVHATQQLESKTRETVELNDELKFLLASMSHDLKAPLISIQGFSSLLQEPSLQDQAKRRGLLKRIESNAEQMMLMLNDMIDFMKVGWLPKEVSDLDLAEISQDVVTLLGADKSSHQVKIEWPQQRVALRSSKQGVRQILLNLLQNALKFSPVGGTIKIEYFSAPSGIRLAVIDQGQGVPAEFSERIFQPFFRCNQEIPGSGMGLSIVKKIVEKLKGRVWLDTEYQGGTRFFVDLPDLEVDDL